MEASAIQQRLDPRAINLMGRSLDLDCFLRLVIKEMEVSNPWGYPQISRLWTGFSTINH